RISVIHAPPKISNLSIDDYTRHQYLKKLAHTEKEKQKNSALNDPSKVIFTMDVQSVTPKLNVSLAYYKMKLVVHNFTFSNLISKRDDCYIGHEKAGEATSNEFTTIVVNQVQNSSTSDIKEVVIFSDGCGYQNGNLSLGNALSNLAEAKGLNFFSFI
ncbi:hypothetical protein ILUMI_15310, partial [Ignelater luminosus]